MTTGLNSTLTRLLPIGLACLVALPASGRDTPTDAATAGQVNVRIAAPEPLRELLEAHFDQSTAPLIDVATRTAFLRRARQEIGDLLATEGYFSPVIMLRPGTDRHPIVDVTPGPRTTVGKVDIEFRGELASGAPDRQSRAERLRARWRLKEGMPFRSADWEEAKAVLLAAVSRQDYAAASLVDSVAEVDPKTSTARLRVVVDSGPAYRFGSLAIHGLRRYSPAFVEQYVTFRSGDRYQREQLLALQRHLQNMPHFKSVSVTAPPDTAVGEVLSVSVELIEAERQSVSLGVGYSSATGARTEINYRSHTLFGTSWGFRSNLRLEENRQSITAAVDTLPDALGYRWLVSSQQERTDIQRLETRRTVLGVSRSRIVGGIENRLALDFQRETKRPTGGLSEVAQALVPDWHWIRRAVDNPTFPRQGTILDLRLGGGSRRLASDQNFLRTQLRTQAWWPVGQRDVVTVRLETGLTIAESRFGIPQEYLFRAGGPQSVRGYPYQSIGVSEGSAIVGGRALATGSVEYTHWLTADWGAALFVDAGGAGDKWRDLTIVSGAGVGARWRSPAGPVGLDFSYGSERRAWRLDFSIMVGF